MCYIVLYCRGCESQLVITIKVKFFKARMKMNLGGFFTVLRKMDKVQKKNRKKDCGNIPK